MGPVGLQNQVLSAVRLGDGPDGAARIAEGQIVVRNVLGHHAARADHHVVSNMDASQDHDIAGQPDIAANVDLLGKLRHGGVPLLIQPHAFLGDQRVVGGHERDVGAKTDVIPDVNSGVIHHGQIEIGKEVFSDEGVAAIVELHRSLKVKGPSHPAQHCPDHVLPPGIILVHGVILLAGGVGLVLQVPQLLLSGVEHLSGKNLFLFRHDKRLPQSGSGRGGLFRLPALAHVDPAQAVGVLRQLVTGQFNG